MVLTYLGLGGVRSLLGPHGPYLSLGGVRSSLELNGSVRIGGRGLSVFGDGPFLYREVSAQDWLHRAVVSRARPATRTSEPPSMLDTWNLVTLTIDYRFTLASILARKSGHPDHRSIDLHWQACWKGNLVTLIIELYIYTGKHAG